MSPIWIEIVLGFGVPVGWGLWELYALRRDKRRAALATQDERQAAPERDAAADSGDGTRGDANDANDGINDGQGANRA